MNIVFFLLPLALLLAVTMLILFIRNVMRGEYDDLESPPLRMLVDDFEDGHTEEISK